MIKLVFLMRRLPTLSFEQFSDHWLNIHAALVRKNAEALGIHRYVQSHIVHPEIIAGFRGDWDVSEPWDGVAEIWLDDVSVLAGAFATPEASAIQAEMMADENRFVDHARSTMLITEEHVLIG